MNTATDLYRLGQVISNDSNYIQALRVALMPYAPRLFDAEVTLQGRVEMVRALDDASLQAVAALLGHDPAQLNPVQSNVRRQLVAWLITTVSKTERFPLTVQETKTGGVRALAPIKIASDSVPVVLLREILDRATLDATPYSETIAALKRLKVTPPGWLAVALSMQPMEVPNWAGLLQVEQVRLEGTRFGHVYKAVLDIPQQTIPLIRALLTSLDIREVVSPQGLFQQVQDFCISADATGEVVLAVLCAPFGGQPKENLPSGLQNQLMMLATALYDSLELKFAYIDQVRVVSRRIGDTRLLQIGQNITEIAQPVVIELGLGALRATSTVRHPAPPGEADFSRYLWLHRLTGNAEDWQKRHSNPRESYQVNQNAQFYLAGDQMESDRVQRFVVGTSAYQFKIQLLGAGVDEVLKQKRRGL